MFFLEYTMNFQPSDIYFQYFFQPLSTLLSPCVSFNVEIYHLLELHMLALLSNNQLNFQDFSIKNAQKR